MKTVIRRYVSLTVKLTEEKRVLEEEETRASEEYIQRLLAEEEELLQEESRRREEDERLARLLSNQLVGVFDCSGFVFILKLLSPEQNIPTSDLVLDLQRNFSATNSPPK